MPSGVTATAAAVATAKSKSSSSPKISNASPISLEEQNFIDEMLSRAEANTDAIQFRYSITDTDGQIQNRTTQPQYKLYLDPVHFVYFSLFFTGSWIYIYIPDIIPSHEDAPYTYTTYTSQSGKTQYYKGNHISISYSELCKLLLFHYTEYDDTYRKTQKICNFKFEGVNESNMKCILCNRTGTIVDSGFFLDEYNPNIRKYTFIFNIVYKIIMTLKHKKQDSKNKNKIKVKKERAAAAKAFAANEAAQVARKIRSANEKETQHKAARKAKTPAVDPEIAALLELLGESSNGAAPTKTKGKTHAKKH